MKKSVGLFVFAFALICVSRADTPVVEVAAGTVTDVQIRYCSNPKMNMEHTLVRFETDHWTDGVYDPVVLYLWFGEVVDTRLHKGDRVKVTMGWAPTEIGRDYRCPMVPKTQEPECGLRTLLSVEPY